jgi:hypothetical protein
LKMNNRPPVSPSMRTFSNREPRDSDSRMWVDAGEKWHGETDRSDVEECGLMWGLGCRVEGFRRD